MLFLILSGLVALAVAITQPRADSQESEHPCSEFPTPLNGIYVLCQKHHQDIVTCVFEKKRLEFVL